MSTGKGSMAAIDVLRLLAGRLGVDVERYRYIAPAGDARLLLAMSEWAADAERRHEDRRHEPDELGDVQPDHLAHTRAEWVWSGDGWTVGCDDDGVALFVEDIDGGRVPDPERLSAVLLSAHRRVGSFVTEGRDR